MPVTPTPMPEWACTAYAAGEPIARLATRLGWSRGRLRRAIQRQMPGALRTAAEQARRAASSMDLDARRARTAAALRRRLELATLRRGADPPLYV